jgi:hypothetical protein
MLGQAVRVLAVMFLGMIGVFSVAAGAWVLLCDAGKHPRDEAATDERRRHVLEGVAVLAFMVIMVGLILAAIIEGLGALGGNPERGWNLIPVIQSLPRE